MAGLLAARVLADAYAEVLIVDRDTLTGVTGPRRGVPQGRHVHGLLARGQLILEELFPGFTETAVAAGIPTADLGALRWYFNGRPLEPADTGLICVSAARPTLERWVRERVAERPHVRFMEGYDILGLNYTADNRRVTGAQVRRQVAGSPVEDLDGDLVVDATGRAARTPAWLAAAGYPRPDEDRVKINLTYTSRHYRLPPEETFDGTVSINPVSSPATPRGAFLTRIGEGRCILSLTGVLGDSAPTDPEGHLAWVESLPVPDIYELVQKLEPLDDPVQHRYPASIRRRYERLDRFPEGLLVTGDAACSFNPVYGQGMTVAALEAVALRRHLRQGSVPDPLTWLRDIAKVIDVPWDISAGGDLAFPGVAGERPMKVRMANAYMGRLQNAAARDGQVTRTFMRVAGLVDPPQAMMRPGMFLRVLRNGGQ
jgi:flavin-dependent dehydrogenase